MCVGVVNCEAYTNTGHPVHRKHGIVRSLNEEKQIEVASLVNASNACMSSTGSSIAEYSVSLPIIGQCSNHYLLRICWKLYGYKCDPFQRRHHSRRLIGCANVCISCSISHQEITPCGASHRYADDAAFFGKLVQLASSGMTSASLDQDMVAMSLQLKWGLS